MSNQVLIVIIILSCSIPTILILIDLVLYMKKLRNIGKPLIILKSRFYNSLVYLPTLILFLIYQLSGSNESLLNPRVIVMINSFTITVIGIALVLIVFRLLSHEKICEKGIVTRKGVFFWEDIILYLWDDSLKKKERQGITFQVKKGQSTIDISLPLRSQEINIINNLIDREGLNELGTS